MLSDKIIALVAQIKSLERELEALVAEESNGKYGVCTRHDIQLWADPDQPHDIKELEQLVGPVHHKYNTVAGCMGYGFHIGSVDGIIIMPYGTSDSRGESDDVSANEEA